MKRFGRLLVLVFVLLSAFVLPSAPASAAACAATTGYAAGNGSVGAPYEIATPEQLQYLVDQVRTNSAQVAGKYFVLTADIDFGGCMLTTSGSDAGFGGFLDGANHTVSNYVISASREAGLFGFIIGGLVKDLVISNASVSSAGPFAGALAGYVQGKIGGPAAFLENITVIDSTVSSSSNSVGGVAGWSIFEVSMQKIRVVNTTVTGTGQYTGGVMGQFNADSGSVLTDVRAIGTTVNGVDRVGGLFGSIGGGFTAASKLGFFAGKVNRTATGSAASDLGGLIGTMAGAVNLSKLAFRGSLDASSDGTSNIGFLIGNADSYSFSVTDSYVRAEGSVESADVVAGLVGNNTGAVSATRGYVQIKVTDKDSGDELSAYPFTVDVATVSDFVYDSEVQTTWAAEPQGAAKTTSELKTASTFSSVAGWSAGLATEIENGTSTATWYSDSSIQNGYQILVWEVLGKSLTPCAAGRYSHDGLATCNPVPAGSFGAFTGQIGYQLCPAGTYQPNVGATECLPARAGYFVDSEGALADTQCLPGTSSNAGATRCFVVPASYTGPVVNSPSISGSVASGSKVALTGSRLGGVTKVEINGLDCAASVNGEGELEITVPAGLAAGTYDLVITSESGKLTVQDGIRVSGNSVAPLTSTVPRPSAKKNDAAGNVKVRIFDVIGAGKVQILVNGEEIAWINAVDATDPKLVNDYLVRTVALAEGKTSIEVYVDGARVQRWAYSK